MNILVSGLKYSQKSHCFWSLNKKVCKIIKSYKDTYISVVTAAPIIKFITATLITATAAAI